MKKEIKNKVKFEAFKYACEGCGIDKFTSEFKILGKKDDKGEYDFDYVLYCSEFDDAVDYGKEVAELESQGYEIIIDGDESEVYDVRAVEEDGEDIKEVYLGGYYE